MSSRITIRFGIKDQKLIHWYNACKCSGIKNISKIIILAIEYHELTGRYIEIAKIRLPEHQEKRVCLCMYIADNSFIHEWFLRNHTKLHSAIRDILNASITVLPDDCIRNELLINCEQLGAFVATIRSRYTLINSNVDSIATGPPIPSPNVMTNIKQFNSNRSGAEQNNLSNNNIISNSDNKVTTPEKEVLSYIFNDNIDSIGTLLDDFNDLADG